MRKMLFWRKEMIKNFMEESLRQEGYFKAFLDFKNYLSNHSESIKRNKLFNQKGINILIDGFLNNLDYCMEYGDYVEFIYNADEKKLVLKKE